MNELITTGGLSLASYAQNLDQQLKVCDLLCKSGLLPKSYSTPAQVFAVVTMGQEYGFSPLRALHLFDHIEGRVAPRAAALQAVAQSHDAVFKVTRSDSEGVTVTVRRKLKNGEFYEDSETFTFEDAKIAGLANKTNWQRYRKDMLYARAVSRLVRRGFGDVLGGLYSSEELSDAIVVEPTVSETAKNEPNTHVFRYDISSAAPEKKSAIVSFLLMNRAEKSTAEDDVWFSTERLKKMDSYYTPVSTREPSAPIEIPAQETPVVDNTIDVDLLEKVARGTHNFDGSPAQAGAV